MSILQRWVDPNKEVLPPSCNEFQTPLDMFEALNKEFNFEYDLACRESNKRVENGLCYPKVDSLKVDWHKLSKGWLWLNPPYSPLKPWVEKVQKEFLLGAKIVMLIPPILNTRYFAKVMPSELRMIVGRVAFVNPDGRPMKGNSHDSCLCIYGPPVMPKVTYVNRDEITTGSKPE